MQLTRSTIDTAKGPADWFTGDVYIDTVAAPAEPARAAAALVHFTPGARTAWHTHPLGQTIFVTEGVARIKELTNGVGADSVLECVGTQESMQQAGRSTRPGGSMGFVGVPHGVEISGERLFYAHIHLHGGPAPVRRFLPELIDLIWTGAIDPGRVFDLTLPLDQAAEGYRAMDERRAIKSLLRP